MSFWTPSRVLVAFVALIGGSAVGVMVVEMEWPWFAALLMVTLCLVAPVYFGLRGSDVRGSTEDLAPPSVAERSVATGWMLFRRITVTPMAISFGIAGAQQLVEGGWRGLLIGSLIVVFGYGLFLAGWYGLGAGDDRPFSEHKRVHASLKRRYRWWF